MFVLATAGHVDHGKSALVKALTGMEPDRWQAERDRGMTIDLGYVWTTLPGGHTVAFVDVPGHERFIANMIVGLAPAPAVMFVVAADEGWSKQSSEHLAAIDALQVSNGLLVITKCDRADPTPVIADATARLAGTSLAGIAHCAVSAHTGLGIDRLREALSALVIRLPAPKIDGRVRLWVDRSFTIRGVGTVVTGTLEQGTIRVGDELTLPGRGRPVRVRGVQSLDRPQPAVSAVARVALNLADIATADLGRGSVLTTPGAWLSTGTVDVRVRPVQQVGSATQRLPSELMLHIGTTSQAARIRPLAETIVRLGFAEPLPLTIGDRALLRSPGAAHVVAGVEVLDPSPPPLRRRGAGRRRGDELAAEKPSLAAEVRRRGVVSRQQAASLGFAPTEFTSAQPGVVRHGDWLVARKAWSGWVDSLSRLLAERAATHPLEPSLSIHAVSTALKLPDRALLDPLVRDATLRLSDGRVDNPAVPASLGVAEPALLSVLERLQADPWTAPEREELDTLGLGSKELAAAARLGRIVRLPGDIVLAPDGPARTMRVLAGLPQPFTLSQARQALGSTRRVVVPLLEYLDGRGWTRRVNSSERVIVR